MLKLKKTLLAIATLSFFIPLAASALNYGEVNPYGLFGYFRMNGSSVDSSPKASATTDATTTYNLASGRFGQGLFVLPSSTFVRISSSTFQGFSTSTLWTASMWLNFTNVTGSEDTFFAIGGNTAQWGVDLSFEGSSQKLRLRHFRVNQASIQADSTSTVLAANQWYNIVSVGTGGNNYLTYVNGALAITLNSNVVANTKSAFGACINAAVSCNNTGAGTNGTLNGPYYIDEIIVSTSTAWSQDQITRYYNQTKGRLLPQTFDQ